MSMYIDGFVLPVSGKNLEKYKSVSGEVAKIWKEYGALAYYEYIGDDLELEGTRSFPEFLKASADEVVIFGWVVFESRKARDLANERVPSDPRMTELISPLTDPANLVFDASRMVYGGFRALVQ